MKDANYTDKKEGNSFQKVSHWYYHSTTDPESRSIGIMLYRAVDVSSTNKSFSNVHILNV